jgi:hypothetical protein
MGLETELERIRSRSILCYADEGSIFNKSLAITSNCIPNCELTRYEEGNAYVVNPILLARYLLFHHQFQVGVLHPFHYAH